jgi:dihydroxy-acid dehydratase
MVEASEIAARLAQAPVQPRPRRGYRALYARTVQQAHLGCDFDFLRAAGEDGPQG